MMAAREPHTDFCARFAKITGLGESLAQAVYEHGIATLEDAELAAYDGRLARIPGFGKRRIETVKRTLDKALGHPTPKSPLFPRPDVATLLDLDAAYRRQAERGDLPCVAPHRFNPEHHAWLPVWHTQRQGWKFTVMYSNTAQAYQLGKRRDWVIIVYEHDDEADHCTIVTEYRGTLQGRRVVRGRERECRDHYYRDNSVADEVRAWARQQKALFT